MFETLRLSLACTSNKWGIWKLFHSVEQWLKSILRDHWPFTRVQKPINSALFSRALTFSSASYIVKFHSTLTGNVATHRKVFAPFLFTGHFGKYHNTLCLFPQILHKLCFQFLLELTMVPRENKNNAYAKFGWTNKEYNRALFWNVLLHLLEQWFLSFGFL